MEVITAKARSGADGTVEAAGKRKIRVARWDETAIRGALEDFLQGWERWPTAEEFAAGGAKGLREAITRVHGAAWWAREMGLPGGDRPIGGVRRWTDETIRQTLADFFGDRSTWPGAKEFRQAGLHSLEEALRHYGGPERWAREMGVDWTPSRRALQRSARGPRSQVSARSRPDWPKWTEETIARELRLFLADRTEWPRHVEFVRAGRKGLYHAVLRHGGTRTWAQRMGVRWVSRRTVGVTQWTDAVIRERLAAFLDGRTTWPSPADFDAAGQRALLRAVRRHGGVGEWAREFGLPPSTLYWTDERIATEVAPLIERLGRWPTRTEFRRAGLARALAAVYGHGGSGRWQAHFGVGPSQFAGPVPDRRRWSEERIDRELRAFCAGRSTWPAFREFRDAGRLRLYNAAARHGGIEHWRVRISAVCFEQSDGVLTRGRLGAIQSSSPNRPN